jgi:hypothetical protein
MFTETAPNLVTSDEGFSVHVLGRTGLQYTEGARTMRIDSEVLQGPSGMIIYTDSIQRWDPPFEAEVVDNVRRSSIVERLRRAFRFWGFEPQIQ